MSRPGIGGGDLPAVFPDWSPYQDLESAARAYLRDPDVALEALGGVLRGAAVLGFTLERFVNEVNGVWQEVVVCDGSRDTPTGNLLQEIVFPRWLRSAKLGISAT